MTGPLTLEIQDLLKPELEELFAELGHDLILVRGGSGTTFGTPSSADSPGTPLRGLLMPASSQRRLAASRQMRAASSASNLPIPAFVAYVLFDDADLSVPGWHLIHQDQRYYPTRDAYSPGGQGVVWVCELGSPGEVTGGDTSQPGWT